MSNQAPEPCGGYESVPVVPNWRDREDYGPAPEPIGGWVLSPVRTVLNWRDRKHYGSVALPCRYCGGTTRLRDEENQPSHKVCAEGYLAAGGMGDE